MQILYALLAIIHPPPLDGSIRFLMQVLYTLFAIIHT